MSKKTVAEIRKCIVTNKRHPKTQLLRVVRQNQVVSIDYTGNCRGRGAYLTPDPKLINKACKKNLLAKALRVSVDATIYDDLLQLALTNSEGVL